MIRALRRILLWGFALSLTASIVLVLVFRWLPVPLSSLMVQRHLTGSKQGGPGYRLHYTWVSLEQMSLFVPLAVIAAEDQKFFAHQGL